MVPDRFDPNELVIRQCKMEISCTVLLVNARNDDMDMDDILKWSQAIIVLFSITSRRSFYRAQELIETLKQTCTVSGRASTLSPQRQSMHATPGSSTATSPLSPIGPGNSGSLRRSAVYGSSNIKPPTVILVANKSDLDRFRLVEKMEAEEFAKRHSIPYYETTAAESYQEVQSIFHSVVRLSSGGRLAKSRGPNGSGAFVSRQLVSSNTSLGSSTGSVLSSLAVSPGLLLQKKSIPPGSTSPISPNEANSSASGGESDQPSSGPVSKLTNLRFRGASPPTFAKNFRSPSPGWPVGRSPSESGPHTNPGQAGSGSSLISSPQSAPPIPPPPVTMSRLMATTSAIASPTGTSSEQTAQPPPPLPPPPPPPPHQSNSSRATTP
ncbi:unnamed protein product, partial [Echinostoma caproni]|uniref:small monomeric GTPase n=1 Tax=Echinostoma caproni TaxID=27848 RepID=A0A183AGS9_9TREM